MARAKSTAKKPSKKLDPAKLAAAKAAFKAFKAKKAGAKKAGAKKAGAKKAGAKNGAPAKPLKMKKPPAVNPTPALHVSFDALRDLLGKGQGHPDVQSVLATAGKVRTN